MYILGAPALTSREFKEDDFVKVVELLDIGVDIAIQAQKNISKYLTISKLIGFYCEN